MSSSAKILSFTLVATAAAAAPLADWASHGEALDAATLARPALLDPTALNARPGRTWEAGENERFRGATVSEAKILMGVLQDVAGAERLPAKTFTADELRDVPAEFDWRTDPRAAKCPSLTEIRDQANCGSCWAFGSVEAMTDRRCIHSNGTHTEHLSAQDVASCCGILHGDMGCNGGVPSTVYGYYQNTGVVTGGNYGDKSMCYSYQLAPCAHHTNSTKYPACPAEVATPKCANACVDDGKQWTGDKHFGLQGYSVCAQNGDDDDATCAEKMAADIYNNGPITGMFFVHQDFLTCEFSFF